MTVEVDEYYDELTSQCNERWQQLSDSVFSDVPQFIIKMFQEFLNNPLCLTITSCLLVVAGFMVLRSILRTFTRGI